jgi:hypothetical protein
VGEGVERRRDASGVYDGVVVQEQQGVATRRSTGEVAGAEKAQVFR